MNLGLPEQPASGMIRVSRSLMRIAVLDDYQSIALTMADWSPLQGRAEVTVFSDHENDEGVLATRLAPYEILCVMRERTALRRSLIERLPKLRLIASTGPINAAIDVAAAEERGIKIVHTGYSSIPTVEMTWALILASQRHLVQEIDSVRSGGWQRTIGRELRGCTLGLLGLGNIGGKVGQIARAFGMSVIGWSENLTSEKAAGVGAVAVSKEELFTRADILSIHTLLSRRTRGLVDEKAIAMMQPASWLINTSRGAIVDETAILEALVHRRIAGFAVDVYDIEPLPAGHPFRTLDNVIATPHLGYVTEDMYRTFYGDTVSNIVRWIEGETSGIATIS